jgi:hypothetical protein
MKRGWSVLVLVVISSLASTGCNLLHRGCNTCRGPLGCRPCTLGWQRGGTDYQRFLSHHSHTPHQHSPNLGSQSGVPAAAVGYPYYTNRGPRDFLLDNPAPIGR